MGVFIQGVRDRSGVSREGVCLYSQSSRVHASRYQNHQVFTTKAVLFDHLDSQFEISPHPLPIKAVLITIIMQFYELSWSDLDRGLVSSMIPSPLRQTVVLIINLHYQVKDVSCINAV